jgi:RNA recognition motif-containing protein
VAGTTDERNLLCDSFDRNAKKKTYLHPVILSLAFVIVHQFCSAQFINSYHCFPQVFLTLNSKNMNIYVSNLSFNIQDEDLKGFFTPFGEVTSAKVINDKFTGQSRGFGFVEMSDNAASQKAIAELDGASVDGRNIKVMEAKPREDRPARPGGGGGSRSGGGGFNKNRW